MKRMTMRRLAAPLLGAFALSFALAAPAAADEPGSFGMGADTALGWAVPATDATVDVRQQLRVPGLSIVYQATDWFGLQLIFGAGFVTGIDDGPDENRTSWGLAVRAILGTSLGESARLGFPVGFSILGARTKPDGGDAGSERAYGIEFGIRPEWFVTDHLSFHTQVGVVLSILDEDYAASLGGDNLGVVFDLFGNANLLGNAGFTWWF